MRISVRNLKLLYGKTVLFQKKQNRIYISSLRKKLESLGSKAEIRSKRGVGYALEVIE